MLVQGEIIFINHSIGSNRWHHRIWFSKKTIAFNMDVLFFLEFWLPLLKQLSRRQSPYLNWKLSIKPSVNKPICQTCLSTRSKQTNRTTHPTACCCCCSSPQQRIRRQASNILLWPICIWINMVYIYKVHISFFNLKHTWYDK